jgi:hypothetical protein
MLGADAVYYDACISIGCLCNRHGLFKVQLTGLILNGAVFSTAPSAVVALNAVIGAAFRGASGPDSKPGIKNYYNRLRRIAVLRIEC